MRIRIAHIILFLTVSASVFGQPFEDELYQSHYEKVSKYEGTENYKKLYKASYKATMELGPEPYFNQQFAIALFHLRDNKKYRIENPNAHFGEIMGYLGVCRDTNYAIDKAFSEQLQAYAWSMTLQEFQADRADMAMNWLYPWLAIFDNSSEAYGNPYGAAIQDSMFNLGKRWFEKGDVDYIHPFDFIEEKFKQSSFTYRYDGNEGYSDEDFYFEEYRHPFYSLANTARDVDYLNKAEKEMIYLHNLVKLDPYKFLETYFFKLYPHFERLAETDSEIKALLKSLQKRDPGKLLYPDKCMSDAAQKHAEELGRGGYVTSSSTESQGPVERMEKAGCDSKPTENRSFSKKKPIHHLLNMLIDNESPTKENRKNILNETDSRIGIGSARHKTAGYCFVINYE